MGIIASSGRTIAVQQLAAEIIRRDVQLPPIIILMPAARNHIRTARCGGRCCCCCCWHADVSGVFPYLGRVFILAIIIAVVCHPVRAWHVRTTGKLKLQSSASRPLYCSVNACSQRSHRWIEPSCSLWTYLQHVGPDPPSGTAYRTAWYQPRLCRPSVSV